MKFLAYSSFFYYLLRFITFPISLLPYRAIHFLGRCLGSLLYLCAPKKIKKITYNNLALAKDLNLSQKEIQRISKESFQNLTINSLEYFRLKRSRHKMNQVVKGKNLDPMYDLLNKGQGVVCVTGHISNWELCFLDHTQKCSGMAIGKQIKNPKLYNFIQSIRQMHGGNIIEMKNAISEGVQQIKKGFFFSMVNDQAYTSSSYSYPFLGARAWTSPAPALIAYKANAPIFSVTTRRLSGGKYEYSLSKPIWPDLTKPLKQEVKRMMDLVLQDFEKEVKENPGQWLWQHKRWKQEGYNYIIHEYKADALLITLPDDPLLFDWINQGLWVIPQIYTRSFLTFIIPQKYQEKFSLKGYETKTYENMNDILIQDYRFQLIYDFYNHQQISDHFLRLGAHKTYSFTDLFSRNKKFDLTQLNKSFEEIFPNIVCLKEAQFIPPS